MKTFSNLGLNDSICKAMQQLEFDSPTEIQTRSIPIYYSKY